MTDGSKSKPQRQPFVYLAAYVTLGSFEALAAKHTKTRSEHWQGSEVEAQPRPACQSYVRRSAGGNYGRHYIGGVRSFTNQRPEDFFEVGEAAGPYCPPNASVLRPTEPCHQLRMDKRLIFSVFL